MKSIKFLISPPKSCCCFLNFIFFVFSQFNAISVAILFCCRSVSGLFIFSVVVFGEDCQWAESAATHLLAIIISGLFRGQRDRKTILKSCCVLFWGFFLLKKFCKTYSTLFAGFTASIPMHLWTVRSVDWS